MNLVTILTIGAQIMEVALGIAQDGRTTANAQEIQQLRSITQVDIAAVQADAAAGPPPPAK